MFFDQINKVIKKTNCRKDFKCLDDRFNNLCKMDYFCIKGSNGDADIFECRDDIRLDCDFRVPLADRYLCKCPVRIELLKQSVDEEA